MLALNQLLLQEVKMTKNRLRKYVVKIKVEQVYNIPIAARNNKAAADAAVKGYEVGRRGHDLFEDQHWVSAIEEVS